MTEEPCADQRLKGIAEICLDLPEAVATTPTTQHCAFQVHGKPFAYYLLDPYGDGHNGVCFKARPGDATAMLEGDPARFRRTTYLSKHGWVCLDLDVAPIVWDELRALLAESYRLVAPRKLAGEVPGAADPEDT